MKKFDLIVIGSGGSTIVVDAALAAGKSCAMIEKDRWGGTCLNHGCIPTKVMVTAANMLVQSQSWERIGIDAQTPKINWKKLSERTWAQINQNQDLEAYYKERDVALYHGKAVFTAEKELAVYNDSGELIETLTAENIVVAAGASCRVPEVPGLEEIGYVSSRSFYGDKYPKAPYKSLIIVGGGAIGCEFAHMFNAFGTKIELVQRNVRLLPKEEPEMSAKLQENFSKRGIQMHFKQDSLKAYMKDGLKCLLIKNRETGEEIEVQGEEILLASGVVASTGGLGADKAGLQLDDAGNIRVNECLETGVPGVFALGDIIGVAAYRHKANNEAELLADNLYGKTKPKLWRRQNYDFLPHVTFAFPEVASVGLREAEAREQGYDLLVGVRHYSENAKGFALGMEAGDVEDGFAKMLVDAKTGRILGVHVIGEEASLLIQAFPYMLNAAPHSIAVRNEDLPASEMCLSARAAANDKPEKALAIADSLGNLREAMTAHPSLYEVVAWLPEKLERI